MSGALDGKLAVVTGASEGIGFAIAERFVAEGADVVVLGRSQAKLDAAVARLGARASAVQGDASSPDDLARLADAVRATGRGVDVLVPNAGGGGIEHPLPEMTPEAFDAVAGLTFRGAYFTVQRMLPVLSDGATVVLVGSIAGANGDAGHAVYNASKAAVRSLARTFTNDLRHRGIRVNAVSPGPTESVGFGDYISGGDPTRADEIRREIAAAVPVGRIGRPSEVAAAVLFLASAESSFVAGVELVVDGGMSQV